MINNIVIVGINRIRSREVSEIVAEQLGMHFLDTIELFEFDHIPRSLSDILKENGEEYFRKKEKSLSGYVGEFENTVIHIESGCVMGEGNIQKLKQNAVIVYLQESATKVKICLQNIETDNVLLKKFFNISIQKIRTRIKLWNDAADIVVSANAGSSLKIAADVIREIENYFLK